MPNRVVKFLVLSDLSFWTGWGMIGPIFPIFLVQRIEGGSALVAGLAASIYLIVRSLLRVPIGIFLDACPSEKDDYFVLFAGTFLTALIPFGFLMAKVPVHIYMIEIIHGIGDAMNLSGWAAIFTRHIDRGKESTEWGIDSTLIGIGAGICGAIGGFVVVKYGFTPVFIAAGLFIILGAFLLLALKNDIKGVFDNGTHVPIKKIFGMKKDG